MKIIETAIKGVLIVEPRVFDDARGYFYESYNKSRFSEAGIDVDFVQDNQSLSQRGAVRGLHGQADPFAQGKLVRVIQGGVMDVAVDIRKGSPTFGKHVSLELSGDNKLQLWIPAGFLHGFATLEDDTIFTYKVNNYYNKESEIGVIWNDPDLAIDWGIAKTELLLSPKDEVLPTFRSFQSPFSF